MEEGDKNACRLWTRSNRTTQGSEDLLHYLVLLSGDGIRHANQRCSLIDRFAMNSGALLVIGVHVAVYTSF